MIRKQTSLAAVAALMALGACATPGMDPANDDDKTRSGALIGAGVGAAIGAISGDNAEERRRRAAIGAVVGAGAGGIIGANLDRQEAELRQDLGSDVLIRNTGDRLIVTLPQDILFATDSDRITASMAGDLVALARSLQKYPDTTVQVIGHTDNTGSAAYNQDLSERRASTVAGVLLNNGVSSRRVQAFGRGESQPIASNLNAEGRAQNRRVEVVILPN